MINSIKDLGEHSLKKKGITLNDPEGILRVLIEDPKSSESYRKIITIEVTNKLDKLDYQRIGIEDYNSQKILLYLYRKGSPNGPDITPISRVTEPEKTLQNKINAWFKEDYSNKKYGLTLEELAFLKKIEKSLHIGYDKILNEFKEEYEKIKRNRENAILTLQIIEDDKKQYLGNFPVFQKILKVKALEKFYNKYNEISKAENKICSVCLSNNEEVYGFVSPYNFYTVDKPGMVAGGFEQKNAWRNYPVCQRCALKLEEGKKYLDEFLKFQFYDYDYYLIPKPIHKEIDEKIYTIFENYHEEASTQRISESHKLLLDDAKEEILDYISGEENSFNNNIMVFREKNSEFKILLNIDGIFPSRLDELFKAKQLVDENPFFQNFKVSLYKDKKKIGEKQYAFNFGSIWHFFGRDKEKDSSGYFLDIVGRIFSGRSLSYPFILNGITSRIEHEFVHVYSIKESVFRGVAFLMFLQNLKLQGDYVSQTNNEKVEGMFEILDTERVKKAEDIFSKYDNFFDCDSKKAVFLVGALSQLLLNIQYSERNATPFRIKLQGLKLDQKLVQSLLPEIQNKLEEYGKNYYKDLEKLASYYFLNAGPSWKLLKDEISFFFALGMNLSSAFKSNLSGVDF